VEETDEFDGVTLTSSRKTSSAFRVAPDPQDGEARFDVICTLHFVGVCP
jgi:hypothetical protein